jgi:hypothetical protein
VNLSRDLLDPIHERGLEREKREMEREPLMREGKKTREGLRERGGRTK